MKRQITVWLSIPNPLLMIVNHAAGVFMTVKNDSNHAARDFAGTPPVYCWSTLMQLVQLVPITWISFQMQS